MWEKVQVSRIFFFSFLCGKELLLGVGRRNDTGSVQKIQTIWKNTKKRVKSSHNSTSIYNFH